MNEKSQIKLLKGHINETLRGKKLITNNQLGSAEIIEAVLIGTSHKVAVEVKSYYKKQNII